MPRNRRKPRRLIADGHTYLWTVRHTHDVTDQGRACRETLWLHPQPVGSGPSLRIVFAAEPGRFVPGGAPLGSGDVGYVRGASLNLHEPGAVRALLDAASARGRRSEGRRPVEFDGWSLLEEAAAARDVSD
ncbi:MULTISPECIES: hypothetical protein [unclassified Streptomyces]|uniref:hypothetical protein n=1 Tax=unclassified Streptomyces TaxID=2593676 RepID=UPI000DBA4A50|nr:MULTISPECIES: hypothetical protein [unclassified Streptomyces]MYT73595.1 hypothetical protein [Streptomyces sp. SID8367]RAJ85132.1 hypothetical protein K377_03613 [Streptomyces sp. PsTaAH-137]